MNEGSLMANEANPIQANLVALPAVEALVLVGMGV